MSSSPRSPNCAYCTLKQCSRSPDKPKPTFCPMTVYPDVISNALTRYEGFIKELHMAASIIEKEGYCIWPRLREVTEFAKKLRMRKLGIAFCVGLSREAEEVVKYFEGMGFETYSVCCKCGGVDKTWIGLKDSDKLIPGTHESMCNPVVQAELLNHVRTELNIVVGLCVGHDTLFILHSKAPVTYLIAKDRVTGHNPVAAVYAQNYFRSRLFPER